MTNLEYYSDKARKIGPVDAYLRHISRFDKSMDATSLAEFCDFLRRSAECALEYDVGDIVKTREEGLLGIVDTVDYNGRDIIINFVDGTRKAISAISVCHAQIPNELIELAKQMVGCPFDLSKCPLKDEGACMRGGTK